MWKKWKTDNSFFPILLTTVKKFSANFIFSDNGLNSQQWSVHLFRKRIIFEGFTIDFKGSKGLLWPIIWYWRKGDIPSFQKIHPDTYKKMLHVNYPRVPVNFASYLRKSQAIFSCGDFCLHPQVILLAEHLTWGYRR